MEAVEFEYRYENLAIFGVGNHTRWLLKEFPDLLNNTVCFLDSDPNNYGSWVYGKQTLMPADCPEHVDTIICSSYDSQHEMAATVGKRAFLLYDDVRAYDVWMGEEDEV